MTGKVREGFSETYWEKWNGTGEVIGEKIGNNEKEKSRIWEVLCDADKERKSKHEHGHAKVDSVSSEFY